MVKVGSGVDLGSTHVYTLFLLMSSISYSFSGVGALNSGMDGFLPLLCFLSPKPIAPGGFLGAKQIL